MTKELSDLFRIGDVAHIVLKEPLYPVCVGSETQLCSDHTDEQETDPITEFRGKYMGNRPGLIKVKPVDPALLNAPMELSRYIVVRETQIAEVYKKVFP